MSDFGTMDAELLGGTGGLGRGRVACRHRGFGGKAGLPPALAGTTTCGFVAGG